MNFEIVKVVGDEKIWPDIQAKKCECVAHIKNEDVTYMAIIPATEVELVLKLKSIQHKLNKEEFSELVRLMDDHALHMYYDGAASTSEDEDL